MAGGAPLIVLVLIASEPREDITPALTTAMEEAARRPVRITTERPTGVDDNGDGATAARSTADVVVDIRWRGALHAAIRTFHRDGRVSRESEVALEPNQSPGERGRAIGYLAAAMLPEDVDTSNLGVGQEVSVPSEGPPPRSEPPTLVAKDETLESRASSVPVPRSPAFAIDGAGLVSAGTAVDAVGVRARVHWMPIHGVSLRGGAERRWFGGLARDAVETGVSTGVLWRFVEVAGWTVGTGVDALVVRDDANVVSTVPTGRGRSTTTTKTPIGGWSGGFSSSIEVGFALTSAVGAFTSVNVEIVSRNLTESPRSPLWATAESGIRLSF